MMGPANTPTAGATLDYAIESSRDQATDQLLRRVVGWGAIVMGGASVISTLLSVGMMTNILMKPANISYATLSAVDVVLWTIDSASRVSLLVAGILLLVRWAPVSIRIIRAASIALVGITVASPLNFYFLHSALRTQFSSLGSIAQLVMNSTHAAIPALLLAALTLPPLGARIVRAP